MSPSYCSSWVQWWRTRPGAADGDSSLPASRGNKDQREAALSVPAAGTWVFGQPILLSSGVSSNWGDRTLASKDSHRSLRDEQQQLQPSAPSSCGGQ